MTATRDKQEFLSPTYYKCRDCNMHSTFKAAKLTISAFKLYQFQTRIPF